MNLGPCIIFKSFSVNQTLNTLMNHSHIKELTRFVTRITIFAFDPSIILKLFLHLEGVTTPENQRIMYKSLLMFYCIIEQNKSGEE